MQKKRKLEKQRRESETNDAKKLGLEKQSLVSSVGQMKTSDARKLRLAKKPKGDKQRRASETNDARKLCLQKKSEVDKEHRTNETDDARQLRLTNKRKAYKSKMSLLNNQKETSGDKNDSASNFLTKDPTNIITGT